MTENAWFWILIALCVVTAGAFLWQFHSLGKVIDRFEAGETPLATDEFADTAIPDTELLYNPIKDTSIGR